ncbi:MAG TPA: hypothetical protein VFX76_15125, partial [Roseiflexaceae bacterium]|nr:hypothetical protein [Roseiflexaceae bacterium]
VAGLQIDEQRMRANLELESGLLMSEALMVALARQVGRAEAQRLAQAAGIQSRNDGISLRQAAQANPQIGALLTPEQLDRALDPALYFGSAGVLIDRALEAYQSLKKQFQ